MLIRVTRGGCNAGLDELDTAMPGWINWLKEALMLANTWEWSGAKILRSMTYLPYPYIHNSARHLESEDRILYLRAGQSMKYQVDAQEPPKNTGPIHQQSICARIGVR